MEQRADGISIVLNAERALEELGFDVVSAIVPKGQRVTEAYNHTEDTENTA